ncbi:ATP-binding cassette domain-containing protein [candidate division CSSED10-310 bacterium]|uniref:ATP-binding cassette domain-containing protein n=1 Tax=candidate division CSSED10-310 bacterium TaxID=2855610 RepID=A0ABV6Z560_UNCC1
MIEIENLDFSYGNQPLFLNLTLRLEQGKIYGLLGKNGAGKTTLFKLLTGLLSPKKGSIRVGSFIPVHRQKAMYEDLFFYPEKTNLPEMKVNEFIKLYSPLYPQWSQEMCFSLLTSMEVPENYKLSQLSFGMLKKFYLIFALSTQCSCYLLDEPTSGLDIPSKKDFRQIVINQFNEDNTIIISSHQVKDFNQLLDEVIIIDKGRIIFKQSIENIESKLALITIPPGQASSEDDVLYQEELGGNVIALVTNTGNYPDKQAVDLEFLFNAVNENYKRINDIFSEIKP